MKTKTPTALGFRMPAEWEPQEAIWLSWPHRLKTWPKHFRPIPRKFAEIAATISRYQDVRINCATALQPRARQLCRQAGAVMKRVQFFNHPTNDTWCRDHGPIFVKHSRTGEVALIDWDYNAWGHKYPHLEEDNAIPAHVARSLWMRRFVKHMVLEGGSVDVNGSGLLLTTEACLLNPNRNPTLSRAEIEQALREMLNVRTIYWLGDGIVGDDTDGHVDDLTRFFSADGIVTAVERNKRDVNYAALAENLARLRKMRMPAGKKFRLVELPMPGPVVCDGKRLPASYANFLIINGAVLMPAFRQPKRDAEAAELLAGCFPDREIIPIDCVDLVLGLGTLHCISQQQPSSAKGLAGSPA